MQTDRPLSWNRRGISLVQSDRKCAEGAAVTSKRERVLYWSAIAILLVTVGLMLQPTLDYIRLRRYAANHLCDPGVEWLRKQVPSINERLPKPDCPGPNGP